MLLKDTDLICANVGDSRAIVGRKRTGMDWSVVSITRDHKGTEPDESKRILSAGGRLEAFKDEDGRDIGPIRVWLKDVDSPGLAMTRSFGDRCGIPAGIVHTPEIYSMKMNHYDKFIVIGSDGIFDFLSNAQVINLVCPFYETLDAFMAAKTLVEYARQRWKEEEKIIDDITCTVVFLNINIE